MSRILCGAAIFLCLATTAFALNCSVCSTATQPDCDDNLKAETNFTFDCNTLPNPFAQMMTIDENIRSIKNATACLKVQYKTKANDTVVHTFRSCYWGNIGLNAVECSATAAYYQGNENQVSCKLCTDNNCEENSAAIGKFSPILGFVLILLRLIL